MTDRRFARWSALAALSLLISITTGRSLPGERPVAAAGAPSEAYRLADRWSSTDASIPAGSFDTPRGVSVDPFDGTVLIADSGNDRVQLFEADGTFRLSIGDDRGPGRLSSPADVVINGGAILVSDHGQDRVAVFDLTGGFRAEWLGLEGPWGITTAADGTVYVAERRASRIAVFEPDGTPSGQLGGFGDGDRLNAPAGLDWSADGDLLVANAGNQRIVRMTRDGLTIDSTGALDAAPLDVAVDGEFRFHATLDDGTIRTYQLGPGLDRVGPVRSLAGLIGIAATSTGELLTTFADDDRPRHGVARWSGSRVVDEWGGVPFPLGRLDRPSRIATDGRDLLVLDRYRRVQRYDRSGTAVAQLGVGTANDVLFHPATTGERFAAVVTRDVSVESVVDLPESPSAWQTQLPTTFDDAPWAVSVAAGPTGGVAVLDVGLQQVHVLDQVDGSVDRSMSFRPGPGARSTLWDLAPGPGGWYVVNRSAGTIERRSDGLLGVLATWEVPGEPLRVSSDPNGNAYVLNRRGWAWKYDQDGELLAVWQVADITSSASRPLDITVDSSGRVFIVDGGLNRIDVYAFDPTGEPGTVPTFDPSCSPTTDKRAAPDRIVLGETVGVTLEVRGDCPSLRTDADIVMVIDVSGSMIGDKLAGAQVAAGAFLDTIDFVDMHVGVVAFNQDANLVQPLTPNPVNVRRAVEGLQAGGGTDIAVALDAARSELTGPRRRPEAASVIVLLTDGGSAPAPAVQAAELAKLEGARLFTIGFGTGANVGLLERLASAPADYYYAPDRSDLTRIYEQIAARIVANSLFSSLDVFDELPSNMRYVQGSAEPPAALEGGRLVWRLADVPLSGVDLTYRLQPLEVGVHPTNVIAFGEGIDGLSHPARIDFPVPIVEVIQPTITPTPIAEPTDTPTPPLPTASPTSTPTPEPVLIFLPVAKNERCPSGRARVDVVLVLDTSTSMSEPTRAGRPKLEAAIEAAEVFLDQLSLDPIDGDRAAIVAFNARERIASHLTADRRALGLALEGLVQAPGTRIDLGLDGARRAFAASQPDPRRVRAVILLTDGRPTGTTRESVIDSARRLVYTGGTDGVRIFAIGVGPDVDGGLLVSLAVGGGRMILAPDAEELASIYREIARELPCVPGP